jgi:hypothetical protein
MAMMLQLTKDDTKRLRERAEAEGTSENDVAIAAIRQYLGTETPIVATEDAVAEVKARYASALKRVGE